MDEVPEYSPEFIEAQSRDWDYAVDYHNQADADRWN